MPDEKTVTASEFARNFGRYRDEAATGEIVNVTIRGRVIGGFLSARQLEEYRRLKRRAQENLIVGEGSDGAVASIGADDDKGGAEGRSRGSAALLVARELSAGRRRAIAPAELVTALETGEVPKALRGHLGGFFEEAPIELVHDMVLEEGLDYGRLLRLAGQLGIEGGTVDWLQEMAGDGLAASA